MATLVRLSGKAAIVTGGAGGIGMATAQLFCAEGAAVALVDVNKRALDEALKTVYSRFRDARVIAVPADVTNEDDARCVVQNARDAFGGLDVLVNNAAVREYLPVAQTTPETWNRILSVNLVGAANASKAALPELRKANGASIINVASVYAVKGRAGMGQYDATKAALLAMTRTLAHEEAEHGIRVNAVCPGATVTRYHVARAEARGQTEAELRGRPNPDCLMKRWAEPMEIAYPILWLASNEASFVTGATLMIDGGASAN